MIKTKVTGNSRIGYTIKTTMLKHGELMVSLETIFPDKVNEWLIREICKLRSPPETWVREASQTLETTEQRLS